MEKIAWNPRKGTSLHCPENVTGSHDYLLRLCVRPLGFRLTTGLRQETVFLDLQSFEPALSETIDS